MDEIPIDVIDRQRRKLTTGFRLFIEACRARNGVKDRDDKAIGELGNIRRVNC